MEPFSQPTETSTSSRKWWVLLTIGIGTFMSALDSSVVNTILPVIRTHFSSYIAAVEWTVTVYLLVVSSLLLVSGRIGDMRGHKTLYTGGFLIFIAASVFCGLATSVTLLVIARGVQAVGGAMMLANSPAILTKSFPPDQRGQALGMQATMTYLGLAVGPSLGGWITQNFGWRAIFYINVPVGFLGFVLGLAFIGADRPKTDHYERFDWCGAVLFSAGLVALLLGLNQGNAWGWISPATLACMGTAVTLLGAFITVERRIPSPMLDLSLFQRRLFSASIVSAVINYICLYSVIFLMPFYLIQGRGLNPAQAGLLLTAQPVVMAISAPISGSLSDRLGSRLLSTLGMAVLAVALFLLSGLGPATPDSTILLFLALTGLGIGVFISPNNSALLGSAPRHRQGIASGVLATARTVGMVLGVGLAGAILTSITAFPGENSLFYAVHVGLLVASGMAVVGTLVSSTRGSG